MVQQVGPDEIVAFFADKRMNVLTLLGYSAAEYEDKPAMLAHVERVLDQHESRATIVNIGATRQGIGAAYEIAKRRGFSTSGIVSTLAKDVRAELSPCVDFLFYVLDTTWGGFLKGTERLSATSTAMVESSDRLVAIGGGPIARDEFIAATRRGKSTLFIPADMNHALASEQAARSNRPVPTDFRGALAEALAR